MIDSSFLQKKFLSFLKRSGHDFSFEYKNLFGKESDILSLENYVLYEYEFKISETDFRRDIKKGRHENSSPNYFYYVVSDETIIKGDYLSYAGIYVHHFSKDGQSHFKLIKEPEIIRDNVVSKEELYLLLKKIYNSKRIL